MRGHRETVRGIDQQYQVNPLYIYDDLRPAPYHDGSPQPANVAVSAFYLKIQTDGGVEGFYGPIDKEVAIVVHEQLRPFLTGKDALAQEKLWDELYRSNRHARRGHYLMAISAVDNTLWDLRGRYFKTPVYRLLGGPTRASVEAYGSCLGYSLEPDKTADARRAGEERRLPLSEVVSRVWPGGRIRGTEEERGDGAPAARGGRRRYRVDVRRLQRVGSQLRARMGAPGGALPSPLDRGGYAGGEDRQFRRTAQGDHDPGRIGRAHSGTLGGLRLSESGRPERGAMRPGVVRRARRNCRRSAR